MNFIKVISYFYPVTKKIPTAFNGILELTIYNGKKVLNSRNANYSYDSLQRVLKFALQQIDLTNVKSILLLGLGGGSVIKTLRDDFLFKGEITAVEMDPAIIEIAAKEFNVKTQPGLKIECMDAFNFIEKDTNIYDLIIIDLFIDTVVQEGVFSEPFWKNSMALMSPKGVFILNADVCVNDNLTDQKLPAFIKHHFNLQKFENVAENNTIFIGQKL